MRRPLAIAVVLAALVAGFALTAASDGGGDPRRYEIVFDNAFGIVEGGDLKIAGVRAGRTTGMRLTGGETPKAVVEAEVTEPGFADLRADARCMIRPQSLIGEYYVDCQPGSSRKRIPDGGRVPVEQTVSTIPIDLVANIMRRPYRERLRLIVAELGAGLAGRPQDLAAVLRRAHPGLRETNETLRLLARETRTIERLVVDGDTVLAALAARKGDVGRFVREAGATAETAAGRRQQLARTFDRLPAFLAELRPYMVELRGLADASTPTLRDLRAGSDDLDLLLRRVGPFARASEPAFSSLGDASEVGLGAVRATDEEVRELRRLAREAPALAKPLRQFLQTTDDRRRAVEPDARAAATDPPAPDKTHIRGRGGFTGMEAFWNFFYWQALATNPIDDVGHVLRLTVLLNACSSYFVGTESRGVIDRCRQWLGPYQPGITAPDPTRPRGTRRPAPVATAAGSEPGPGSVAASGTGAGARAAAVPGDPGGAAGATPAGGSPLLDALLRRAAGGAGAASERGADPGAEPSAPGEPGTQVLDYLLTP